MVRESRLRRQPIQRKIELSTNFVTSLAEIKIFSENTFGKIVANRFISEIRRQISLLSRQPNAHPKNRFIENTESKVYRNIIHKNYCVLYSVTSTVIVVIEIYHTAINPEIIKTFEK